VVANKMDEPSAAQNMKKFKARIRKVPLLPMAAAFDEGVDTFKKRIREELDALAIPAP
jgi:predicted GTPase